MKEDKLALIKAVDSGDTDLGKRFPSTPVALLLISFLLSVPCPITSPQETSAWIVLQASRGWRRPPGTRGQTLGGLCTGAEQGNAPRLLLLR
jgi:hypothetical protein